MKVAVTGASGHLGGFCVPALQAAGHETLVVPREVRQAGVPSLRTALAGVEAVVHLAGHIPEDTARLDPDDAEATLRGNAAGTAALLEALATARHLRAVVYASSFEVYGLPLALPIREDHPTRPLSFYGAAKLAGEHFVRLFGAARGLPCCNLRLPAVYGPGARLRSAISNFIRDAAAGRPPEIHGSGEDRRDLVYAKDAADAVVRALATGARGEINLGSGTGYRVAELAEAVCRVARLAAPPARLPSRKPARDYVLDITRAKQELGWEPRTRLDAGIAAQLAWVRAGG